MIGEDVRAKVLDGRLHVRPGPRGGDRVFLGPSEYGVAPSHRIDPIGVPPRAEWVHYIAGCERGRYLAAEHMMHDGSFMADERAAYLATIICDDPSAAFDAYWCGLAREYWA